MSRTSLVLILIVLLTSLSLLSVLSIILAGYPEGSDLSDPARKGDGKAEEEEPSILLFKVAPATPELYWRIWSADYYTGLQWLRTTDEEILGSFPWVQDANATRVFTVEINSSQSEFFLPVASPSSTPANMSVERSIVGLKFFEDITGNAYRATAEEFAKQRTLSYKVLWSDVEIDDTSISVDTTPDEIREKYLQLPSLPLEVIQLARSLEDVSYSVLDQILADLQYLRTSFVYDFERLRNTYVNIVKGSDIASYIERRRGTCIDGATALATILRIQKIPARISVGYKAGKVEGGKLLYYTTGAHSVTEVYLEPYGWVQFDATPPIEEDPQVKLFPVKKVSSPGSELFHQLSITNRGDSTDTFKLFVENKKNWSMQIVPQEIRMEASQTAEALLEITIPREANIGEKDVVTVTVASTRNPEGAFSVVAITQVADILQISTRTTITDVNQAIFRNSTFWVKGTVIAANDEQVDNMTIYALLTEPRGNGGLIVGKGYSRQGDFEIENKAPIYLEIGSYKLDVVSVGKAQYTPSSDASSLVVRATTEMGFTSDEKLPLGYGAIHGALLLDNGTGLARAPISFEISSLSIPSEALRLQSLTYADGSFRIENAFENPGVYEVRAAFYGDEYILGSDAEHIARLERGMPSIQLFAENTAIRGDVLNITGTVKFGDSGVRGEPITVSFDNRPLATTETTQAGYYTYSFLLDSNENLGLHFVAVALEKGDASAIHNVVVKSKTTLTARVSEIAGGMLLLYSASLSDDHGLPIQDAEIVVDKYSLSWKTDRNGDVTFLVDAMKLLPENSSLTAKFEGSELYLPVSAENEVAFEPVISLPYLIPLICPILVVITLAPAKLLATRRQALRHTGAMKIMEETPIEHKQEELIYEPQETPPFRIVFPDIKAKFPYVWGAGDELQIDVALDKAVLDKIENQEVEIIIDEETVAHVGLSQEGRAEFSHVFGEKGDHKLLAVLPTSTFEPLSAEIRLRVVDYGEENIRLYNEFLGKLNSHSIPAQDSMTAREVENLILKVSDMSSEALRNVTKCFEKAEYSNHPATREDYEILYLSLAELNLDVGHKK